MILTTARVTDFKSVTDSDWVRIEDTVTCLVGKNESGKTAFLEALYRLNPVHTGHAEKFEGLRDYPRPRFANERDQAAEAIVIRAKFALDQDDVKAVEDQLGSGVLTNPEVEVSRGYDGTLYWSLATDETAAVKHLVAAHGAKASLAEGVTRVRDLVSKLRTQQESGGVTVSQELMEAAEGLTVRRQVMDILRPRLPRFFYFDEYSELPGRVSIPVLQNTAPEDLEADQQTALSLLRLAGVESEEFTEDTYEARRASLEAASSAISQEVFEFWSQNKNLRVYFDADWKSANVPATELPVLEIRIENQRYYVTLNFAERSAGFQWFFSFLAAFSEFRNSKEPLILLLDEPALGLHATAQSDLLRYIDERLAEHRQVIYTTHSPFMVDPRQLLRARTVEDRENEGTKVGSDVLSTSRETLYPLQAALGYELAQTLFVAPDNLAVEGPSDFIYLQVMSELLHARRREGLDPRWVIVPVGGVDKLPTFIALLGANLNVAVVLDGAAGGTQKINSMIDRGIIDAASVIPLARITGGKEADIEDMFDESWYLGLVRDSKAIHVTKTKLASGSRIVDRIERGIGPFDHFRPAAHLLRNQTKYIERLPEDTLDRFEALFKRINPQLS